MLVSLSPADDGNRGRRTLRAAATLATLAVFASVATAAHTAGSATGKLCGASRCLVLPRALALSLSEQNDTVTSQGRAQTAPYYKIVIHGKGEGHMPNRTWMARLSPASA